LGEIDSLGELPLQVQWFDAVIGDHWMIRLTEGVVLGAIRERDEAWLERVDDGPMSPEWICGVWRTFRGYPISVDRLRKEIRKWWT